MRILDDLNDCKNSVPWIRSIYPAIDTNVHETYFEPKGCVVWFDTDPHTPDAIVFNRGPSDKPNEDSRQVCLEGTISNAFYIK